MQPRQAQDEAVKDNGGCKIQDDDDTDNTIPIKFVIDTRATVLSI